MIHSIRYRFIPFAIFLWLIIARPCFGASHAWIPVGPDGGDARSFAADPSDPAHIYLGTTDSWLYDTHDGGNSWKRLSKLPSSDHLILDNVLVDESDPSTLFVGAWELDRADGGLFISYDGGESWSSVPAMKGQSIRALAQAASNPKILVAGTLKGVYRSEDGGAQWTQISPVGSSELHEVESVAIDPKNPATIYVGTWHLPWKTTDGGASWHSIKQGLIDDSDVFSIIIDPTQPNVVYTSACSGIYKSENGGEVYHKIQGIPSTARRTRVLMQDPANPATVYAGTTEGLYKSIDSGVKWQRMTSPDVIVNDVQVDPKNPQRVLLATDRSGVLASDNGAISFNGSNSGFSQRQVASLLVDARSPRTIYAGVLNDKSYGGVFVSRDLGKTWRQQSDGLEGRDVYSLAEAAGGSVLAGTNAGIFRWDGSRWSADEKVLLATKKTSYVIRKHKRVKVEKTVMAPGGEIGSRVGAIATDGPVWVAATSSGVFTSDNQGVSWQGGPVLGRRSFAMAAARDGQIAAGDGGMLALSSDGGRSWRQATLPPSATWLQAVTYAGDGSLWLGGRNGVLFSRDGGQTWQPLSKLPVRDISGVSFDPGMKRVIVTSWDSTWVFAVDPATENWKWWDAGWRVHHVRSSDGRVFAATMLNGVVMQPGSLPMMGSPNGAR